MKVPVLDIIKNISLYIYSNYGHGHSKPIFTMFHKDYLKIQVVNC